jgi:prepilin-type N-terminal cleavage/methylation domain-containing protein/prepilin-type processing-associated H-X9-DG protein
MRSDFPRKSGFTLIELLVVIAIIAILAAILFPVFAKAREKARQTSCLSNEKQMALGVLMYAQDYDEKFPGGGGMYPPGAWGPGSAWWEEIYPYIKNTQIFVCPSHGSAPMSEGGYPKSYGCNWNFLTWGAVNPPMSLAQVVNVSGTIMLAENNTHDWPALWDTNTTPASLYLNVQNRHNEGANYAFMDGHAKWLRQYTSTSPDNLWDNL